MQIRSLVGITFRNLRVDVLGVGYLDYSAHKDGTYQDLVSANPEFRRALEARRLRATEDTDPLPLLCTFCRGRSVDPKTRGCRLCGHWEPELWKFDDDLPF